ncbi:unnamed protein product, partial [Polarella glacialis]
MAEPAVSSPWNAELKRQSWAARPCSQSPEAMTISPSLSPEQWHSVLGESDMKDSHRRRRSSCGGALGDDSRVRMKLGFEHAMDRYSSLRLGATDMGGQPKDSSDVFSWGRDRLAESAGLNNKDGLPGGILGLGNLGLRALAGVPSPTRGGGSPAKATAQQRNRRASTGSSDFDAPGEAWGWQGIGAHARLGLVSGSSSSARHDLSTSPVPKFSASLSGDASRRRSSLLSGGHAPLCESERVASLAGTAAVGTDRGSSLRSASSGFSASSSWDTSVDRR